jgi:hypothetical protein
MSVSLRPATKEERGFTFAKAQAFILVERAGKVVGFIVKQKNTKREWHPWKVFVAGAGSVMLGVFFNDDDITEAEAQADGCKRGGMKAAEDFALSYFK